MRKSRFFLLLAVVVVLLAIFLAAAIFAKDYLLGFLAIVGGIYTLARIVNGFRTNPAGTAIYMVIVGVVGWAITDLAGGVLSLWPWFPIVVGIVTVFVRGM